MSKRRVLAAASVVLLGLLALVAGVVYFVSSPEFERFVADAIVRFLEERTGARVTLESFDADFGRQLFTLNGLELRGEEDRAEAPLAAIEQIQIGFRLWGLLSRQVDLSSLTVERPEIAFRVAEDGSTNVPSPPAREREPPPFELSVGVLVVSGGALEINENRVDIDFDLSEVNGRFEYAEPTGVLSGHLEYLGALERPDAPLIPYALSTDFDYTARTILLHTVRLESGDDTAVTLQGRVDEVPEALDVALEYVGVIDLPFLNYFFRNERFEGSMDVGGRLRYAAGRFTTEGRMTAERLVVEDWTATDITSDFEYLFPERRLEARNLEASIVGGRVEGTARVLPLPGLSRVELDLRFQNVDTARLSRIYPWDPSYLIESRASGTLGGWFQGKFRDFELSGNAVLIAKDVPFRQGSFPRAIAGSTAFLGTPEGLTVTDATGRFGSTRVRADGWIGSDDTALDFALDSGDLRDLRFLSDAANGSGTFEGTLRGRIGQPAIDTRFALSDYEYQDWVVDAMEGRASLAGNAVDLEDVRVSEGQSELRVNGSYDLERSVPDLDIEILRLAGEHLRRVTGRPVSGSASGRVRLRAIEPIQLDGRVGIEQLAYEDRVFGDASAQISVGASEIRLTDLSVRDGLRNLAGDLYYDTESMSLDADFEASGQRLEDLHWLGVPADLSGVVRQAAFDIESAPGDLKVDGSATIDSFRFRQQFFPELAVEIETTGPLLHVALRTDEHLELEADVETRQAGYPFRGLARFSDYDGGALVTAVPGPLRATGFVSFEGSLADPRSLSGRGEIETLTVVFEGSELSTSRPFGLEFDTESVAVSRLTLEGDATLLEIGGTVAIEPEAPLDLVVNGRVNLDRLSPASADWAATGDISLGGQIQGNLGQPELSGLATLEDVSLSHDRLFLTLSALNGDLYFDRSRIGFNDVRGTAGGGDVIISGAIGLEGNLPGTFDIRLDTSDIRVRSGSGLRAEFDGALLLLGTVADPRLEGNVQILSLTFDESFEEFLGLFGSGVESGEPEGVLDDLTLRIHVQGDRNIRIENDLVRVESRLDLDVGGTFGDPGLTGHVEVTDGTLDFQGERYRITRGNVDFVDPIQIEPLVDVEAETEVRDYRIILTISGRGEDLQLSMRSDPPLSELEIVSLIAGGRTREEFARDLGTAAPTSEELFQGGAANILADLLQERVGSRLGVLNNIRIDPFLVGAETDPVARVTISEQVTRDLTITYSQDLSSNTQQIIQIEYFLNNDTSFIASRDETGALGLDIKLRKRFR